MIYVYLFHNHTICGLATIVIVRNIIQYTFHPIIYLCSHKRCVKKRPSNMSVLPKKGALTNRKRKRPDKHEPVQKNKRRRVNASGASVTSNVKVVRRRRVRNKRGDLVTRAELAKGTPEFCSSMKGLT